jgi:CDGSH-type Zn-finger protein
MSPLDAARLPVQRRSQRHAVASVVSIQSSLGFDARMKITIKKNGPLLVSTDVEIELVNSEGKPVTPPNAKTFALCRCGHSEKKPFCDGSHVKCGFVAE